MSLNYSMKFSATALIMTLMFLFQTNDTQAQYKRNKSSITGKKFKVRNKKKPLSARIPRNYLNSLKLTAGTSANSYFGDLCSGGDCVRFRPGLNVGLHYRMNTHFSFQAFTGWRRLYSNDADGQNASRNLSFRGDNFEFAVTSAYDIFPYNKMFRRRSFIIPYVFAGIGFVQFNPSAEYDGKYYALRPLQTEGEEYSGAAFMIPYGFGARLKINPVVNVAFEVGYRLVFTDYLDDVSNEYNPDNYELANDEVARILTDRRGEYDPTENKVGGRRGNPESNDGYIVYGIQMEYTIKVTRQRYSINANPARMRMIRGAKKK